MTGHMIAASGVVELIVTSLALRDQFLPPTITQIEPDPECTLDYVPNVGRNAAFDYALTNTFGFGGTNVSIAVRKV